MAFLPLVDSVVPVFTRAVSTVARGEVVAHRRGACGEVVCNAACAEDGRSPGDTGDTGAAVPGPSTLRHYLTALSVLADGPPAVSEDAELVHQTVAFLIEAAADQGVSMPVPRGTDSHVAHLRALARLAERTIRRDVPVRQPFAHRLDDLVAKVARTTARADGEDAAMSW